MNRFILHSIFCFFLFFLFTTIISAEDTNSFSNILMIEESCPEKLENKKITFPTENNLLGINCSPSTFVACSSGDYYIPATTVDGVCTNVFIITQVIDSDNTVLYTFSGNGGGPVDLSYCENYTIRYTFTSDDCPSEFCTSLFTITDNQNPIVDEIYDRTVCQDYNIESNCGVGLTICAPSVTECSTTYYTYYQVNNSNNTAVAAGAFPQNSTPDNCIELGFFPFDDYTVTYTVEDECTNQTSISYVASLLDCASPRPICFFGLSASLGADGLVEIPAVLFDEGSSDACSAPINFSFSSDSTETTRTFNCDHVGTSDVELWVTDAAGNQNFCTTFIVIQPNLQSCTNDDSLPTSCEPVPICLFGLSIALPPDDQSVEMTADMFDAGSYGSCGASQLNFSLSPNIVDATQVLDCNNLGTNDVNMWVTDENGNQNFCVTFIVVQSNLDDGCAPSQADCSPSPVCHFGLSVALDKNGIAELPISDFHKATINDCGTTIIDIAFDQNSTQYTRVFTCDDLQTQNVELWITDENNNKNFCTTFVIIQPNPETSVPVSIIGCETVCSNSGTHIYEAYYDGISGASPTTSFLWTISSGGTIISGQGTSVVEVEFQSSSVQLMVYPNDDDFCYAPINKTISVEQNCVLPGDVNENGEVNWVTDWLALQSAAPDFLNGIQDVNWLDYQNNYIRTLLCPVSGTEQLYDWRPQFIKDWRHPTTYHLMEYNNIMGTSHNLKHADADGDALINPNMGILYNSNNNVNYPPETDSDVIHYNAGATTPPVVFSNFSEFTFDYQYENQNDQTALVINVYLGTPAQALTAVQSVGFELNFDLAAYDRPNIDFRNSYLSNDNVQLRTANYETNIDASSTYLYIGLDRLDDNNLMSDHSSHRSSVGVDFTGQLLCQFVCDFDPDLVDPMTAMPLTITVNDAAFIKTDGSIQDLNPTVYSEMVSQTALPIELLSFKASSQQQHIQLDWAVENQLNFSHFELERSMDGRTFIELTKIATKEQYNGLYGFADYTASRHQLYYYRLKLVDDNEASSYSSIVMAKLMNKTDLAFQVDPNPFHQTCKLSFETIEAQTYQVLIRNTNGQVLKRLSYAATTGRNELILPTDDLPNGIYFCESEGKTGRQILKIVKL